MSPTAPTSETVYTESRPREVDEIVRSLRALLEGDPREQRETFSFLKEALDQDRPSNRKLFPSA
jgi:hypothetical protein